MVYFVGAGTGAVDLITVRGMHLLEQADVIIYAGSLVNPELLAYAKKDCEMYNSAKLTLFMGQSGSRWMSWTDLEFLMRAVRG